MCANDNKTTQKKGEETKMLCTGTLEKFNLGHCLHQLVVFLTAFYFAISVHFQFKIILLMQLTQSFSIQSSASAFSATLDSTVTLGLAMGN